MDIVERLRLGDFSPFSGEYIKDADKDEAADEIERLREEVEHLHKMTVKWSALQVEGSQENQRLLEALRRVIAVADRDTVDFRFAKVAIAKATRGE